MSYDLTGFRFAMISLTQKKNKFYETPMDVYIIALFRHPDMSWRVEEDLSVIQNQSYGCWWPGDTIIGIQYFPRKKD